MIGLELSSIRVQTDELHHEWRENTHGRPAPINPLHRRQLLIKLEIFRGKFDVDQLIRVLNRLFKFG